MTKNEFFENKYIDDIEALYAKHGNFFAPILHEFARQFPSGQRAKVLDIGCGNGIFTADLKKTMACELHGVDLSDYALEKAKANGFDEVARIGDLSNSRLPFEDTFFDGIIVKDVFEHLLFPLNLLREVKRILKPGGIILVHVPNHFTLFRRFKFLFTGNIDTFRYFPGAKAWEYPHIRFFSSESLHEFLELNRFEVISDLGYVFPDRLPKINRVWGYERLARALARKSPSLFVEGLTLIARNK